MGNAIFGYMYLKTPLVADLSVQVEIHFYHQQSVTGPGQARGAVAVRSSHVTRAIEESKVVVSCKSPESCLSVFLHDLNYLRFIYIHFTIQILGSQSLTFLSITGCEFTLKMFLYEIEQCK